MSMQLSNWSKNAKDSLGGRHMQLLVLAIKSDGAGDLKARLGPDRCMCTLQGKKRCECNHK